MLAVFFESLSEFYEPTQATSRVVGSVGHRGGAIGRVVGCGAERRRVAFPVTFPAQKVFVCIRLTVARFFTQRECLGHPLTTGSIPRQVFGSTRVMLESRRLRCSIPSHRLSG